MENGTNIIIIKGFVHNLYVNNINFITFLPLITSHLLPEISPTKLSYCSQKHL